jgi:hypothetical protein
MKKNLFVITLCLVAPSISLGGVFFAWGHHHDNIAHNQSIKTIRPNSQSTKPTAQPTISQPNQDQSIVF